ncbi:hypothetical protein REPUB_Repub04eG0150400 [Reevesia pubescens]
MDEAGVPVNPTPINPFSKPVAKSYHCRTMCCDCESFWDAEELLSWIGEFELRRQIHGYIVKFGLESEVFVGTPVVDSYVKCACFESACQSFERISEPNDASWSAIITGYCQIDFNMGVQAHADAIKENSGVRPNEVTFVAVLTACSHSGLVTEAKLYLESMSCEYGVKPTIDHFNSENLIQLDPDDTAAICFIWEMGKKQLINEGKVHRCDKHHPKTEEIYGKWRLTEEDMCHFGLPERKEHLMDNSERLAIPFGLISLPSNAPIFVFKNLRTCQDCPDFAKHVSMVTGRKITVIDSSRFHHFYLGQCSCNDYR